MKNSTLRTPEQYISMPWKNGAGTTIELLKRDLPDHVDFLWRISMATVSDNGLFSTFEHYDRTLVLLEGNGMTLQHKNDQVDTLTKPLHYAQFSGDADTTAQLHNGPITDFNIMTRKGVCGSVTHCGSGSKNIKPRSDTTTLLIYAVEDVLRISDGVKNNSEIPHRSLLIIEPPPEKTFQIDGPAFIAVEIAESLASIY